MGTKHTVTTNTVILASKNGPIRITCGPNIGTAEQPKYRGFLEGVTDSPEVQVSWTNAPDKPNLRIQIITTANWQDGVNVGMTSYTSGGIA